MSFVLSFLLSYFTTSSAYLQNLLAIGCEMFLLFLYIFSCTSSHRLNVSRIEAVGSLVWPQNCVSQANGRSFCSPLSSSSSQLESTILRTSWELIEKGADSWLAHFYSLPEHEAFTLQSDNVRWDEWGRCVLGPPFQRSKHLKFHFFRHHFCVIFLARWLVTLPLPLPLLFSRFSFLILSWPPFLSLRRRLHCQRLVKEQNALCIHEALR